LLPRCLIAALADVIVLAYAWISLQLFRVWLKIGREPEAGLLRSTSRISNPSQAGLDAPGGALTHVTGFLSGLVQEGARCAIFPGRTLQAGCDVYHISGTRFPYLIREGAMLSYNIRFISVARKLLAQKRRACCIRGTEDLCLPVRSVALDGNSIGARIQRLRRLDGKSIGTPRVSVPCLGCARECR